MPRRERAPAHPPLRWFADRADGVLSASRAERLAAHLATGCAVCVARESRLVRTLSTMRVGALEAPPKALRAAAVRLHVEARLRSVIASAREIVARLVFDGRTAAAVALRAAPGDERRLLWDAGSWEVDACIVTGTRGSDVLGQVVPIREAERAADVDGAMTARSGRSVRRAPLAADGRFAFRGLPPGLWAFEARIGGARVTFPPFVVERGG